MASPEWLKAVMRYNSQAPEKRKRINELYMQRWRSHPDEWCAINSFSPNDAMILDQAVDDVLGIIKQHLTSAADEYDETMKAMEIMSDLK